MRIIAINGSPAGRNGNTDVLVQAFLNGAADAGAETETVYLAERKIGHCRGCHSCWSATPGRCVLQDDMASVMGRVVGRPAEHDSPCCAPRGRPAEHDSPRRAPQGAGIIVLASPVYLANVSGTLKDFIDRLTVTGNPHAPQPAPGAGPSVPPPSPPRFVMASTCGFPGSGQFDVVSLWARRFAAMMGTTVAAEIYRAQGRALRTPTEEQRPGVDAFLATVTEAGRTLAAGGAVSETELAALRGAAPSG